MNYVHSKRLVVGVNSTVLTVMAKAVPIWSSATALKASTTVPLVETSDELPTPVEMSVASPQVMMAA